EAMSVHDLSHFIEDFDLSQSIFNLAQKFLLYSGPPATGKTDLRKTLFDPEAKTGIYSHLVERLILYHTREPRLKDGISEKDGVDYHFRDEKILARLEVKGKVIQRQTEERIIVLDEKGKIITTLVNNQLQGLAIDDFEEELVINKADLADDKRGIILDADKIVSETERTIIIRRQIRGLSSVFGGKKLVILEGGYGWFYALKKDARYRDKYKDVLAIFILPFNNDQEIQVRANNTKIIDGLLGRPVEKAAAYLEMFNLISKIKREINLDVDHGFLHVIRNSAEKNATNLTGTTPAINTAVIESKRFLDDIFVVPSPTLDKEDIAQIKAQRQTLSENDIAIIKAMAYEVNRRIIADRGELRFYLAKREMPEGVEDREYDRYQRVLEGVRQIIWRNQYKEISGLILSNPWGWTQEARNTTKIKLINEFGHAFFAHVVRAMRDASRTCDLKTWPEKKAQSPTGRQTKESYLARIAQLSSQGRVRTIPKDELRFEMTPEDIQRYFISIREVLTERKQSVVNPEILFEAAKRALAIVGRASQVEARIAVQPGTMNPLTYGHITAGLAAIIDKQINRVILVNGGTVPDKPYAASADIRNEMANIATLDPGLSDWLLVTPIRAQVVDMFESREALYLAGTEEVASKLREELTTEVDNIFAEHLIDAEEKIKALERINSIDRDELRRRNMDIAAFIWLFVANPNVTWFYTIGSDKLIGYHTERNLIEYTLHALGVEIIYAMRAGSGYSFEKHIKPYIWLNRLWREGLFTAAVTPSSKDLSATQVRYALAYNEDTIDEIPLSEMFPIGVVNYIRDNPELLSLYRIEFLEREAKKLIKQKRPQEANAKYQQAIQMIDQLTSSGATTTEASFQILRDNLVSKLKYAALNIVFVSPEVAPLSRTGGLGDVSHDLPIALNKLGVNITIFTLKYENIDTSKLEFIDTVQIIIHGEIIGLIIWRTELEGVTVYLLEDDIGYSSGIYQGDTLRQAIVLCEGTFKAIERLHQRGILAKPNLMHANDWQAGLMPVFLKTKYDLHPLFANLVSVFTIHNLAYQGGVFNRFPGWRFDDLGIDGKHWFGLVSPGDPESFNIMRGALYHAHKISTVSQTYAHEILGIKYGEGLDGCLRERFYDLVGIINGIDLIGNEIETPELRTVNKEKLQTEFGLQVNVNIPVLVMPISRITWQKNQLMTLRVIERLLTETEGGIEFILTGKGHPDDNYLFEVRQLAQRLANDWPGRVAYRFTNERDITTMMFKGADILLMPSQFEPGGLAQLVALSYGCIPVVRRTGGLADTVQEFNPATGKGNGFAFDNADDNEFYDAVARALRLYRNPDLWRRIIENAQSEDRSWKKSAEKYIELYLAALRRAFPDSSRPLPDQPMPSTRKVNASVRTVGWDSNRVAAVGIDSIEVSLAAGYLRSINREDMASYLEYLARAGLIRAGPFEDFLAATYMINRTAEGIALNNTHPIHNNPIERAASLIHEIGATKRFNLTHIENTQREKAFKESLSGKQTKESYLARIAQLSSQGRVRTIPKDELRFEMTPEDIQRYFTA
ncbi:MAG: glycogen/starch synthase, partial [Candidatus Omnitrophota bacterium]